MAELLKILNALKSISTFPGTLWQFLEALVVNHGSLIQRVEALEQAAANPPESSGGSSALDGVLARLAALEAAAGQGKK